MVIIEMPGDGRRNPWLDWLRLLGISGAVWLHIGGPGAQYTPFRMPLVALITAYLSIHSRDRLRACRRLLVPLLFWGSIASLFWARYLLHHSPHFMSDLAAMAYFEFFQSPLWYLPFAALVVLLIPLLRPLPSALAVLLALLAMVYSRWLSEHTGMPFRQWALVAPTIPLAWVAWRRHFGHLGGFLVGCLFLPNGARCGPAVALFVLALVAPARHVPAAPERLGRLLYMGQVVGCWLIYYVVRREEYLRPPVVFALLVAWAACLVWLDARWRALRGTWLTPRWQAWRDSLKVKGANPEPTYGVLRMAGASLPFRPQPCDPRPDPWGYLPPPE
jgi:hypothetical protein